MAETESKCACDILPFLRTNTEFAREQILEVGERLEVEREASRALEARAVRAEEEVHDLRRKVAELSDKLYRLKQQTP